MLATHPIAVYYIFGTTNNPSLAWRIMCFFGAVIQR